VLNFVQGWLPQVLVDTIGSFSFLTHFNAIKKGVIDVRDVIFLASLIGLFLYANVTLVELKKSA
jgi:gliding motility-associated transport system permease protein